MYVYLVCRKAKKGTPCCCLLINFWVAEDFNFKIQRTHHSLASKPCPKAPPRPIIVNFLKNSKKEMVLSEVWKKGKIRLEKYIFWPQLCTRNHQKTQGLCCHQDSNQRQGHSFPDTIYKYEDSLGLWRAYIQQRSGGLQVENTGISSGRTWIPVRRGRRWLTMTVIFHWL